MLYSHTQLRNTYTNICRNIVNNNDDFNERTNTLLYKKIYLSHVILERAAKGLKLVVWEVSWRRGQTATYWPKILLTIAALFPHSGRAAQPWVTEGRKPSVSKLNLTLASCPQRTPTTTGTRTRTDKPKPSVAPGYIIVCRSRASCGRTHLHRIQRHPQVKVIFRYLRPDAPVSLFSCLFSTGASFDWRLGRGSICYNFILY